MTQNQPKGIALQLSWHLACEVVSATLRIGFAGAGAGAGTGAGAGAKVDEDEDEDEICAVSESNKSRKKSVIILREEELTEFRADFPRKYVFSLTDSLQAWCARFSDTGTKRQAAERRLLE